MTGRELFVRPAPEPGWHVLVDESGEVLARYKDGCEYCDYFKAKKEGFFPDHEATSRCRSGRRNHCTCDTCF